jgi:hypothetical protein
MLASDEFVNTCPDGKRAWMLFFAYLVDSVRADYDKIVVRCACALARVNERCRGCGGLSEQICRNGIRDFFIGTCSRTALNDSNSSAAGEQVQ